MTKRILTIILVLLAVAFLLLGGIWLVGRHEAQKNGTTPLTFRQFLGLGTSAKPASTAGGTLTSTFTNPNGATGSGTADNGIGQTTIGPNGTITSTVDNTQVSQFTGSSISPTDNGLINSATIGGGSPFNGSGTIGTGTTLPSGTPITGGTTGNGSTAGAIAAGLGGTSCSTADTTITFTASEIQQLNALQAQYNAIAANLATESDAANELSNYNDEKLQEAKIAELQNFCQTNVPLLTDPELRRHVPTPFWHDINQDSETFTLSGITTPVGAAYQPLFNAPATAYSNADAASFLERMLRINLW